MKKKEENFWQILVEDRRYGIPICQDWFETKAEAEEKLAKCKDLWPEDFFWLEQGTEHIKHKCRKCGSVYANEMFDNYGISTGHWCNDCYENNYPYRKDDYYDYFNAGEYLNPEDY